MHGPPMVAWLLVVLSGAAGVSCLLRREARDEALMAAGMAVMAVPMSVFDPGPWGTPVLAAVFALAAVRALLPAHRSGHHLHHSVSSAAMAYMAVAMAGAGPAGAHAGHAGHSAHPGAGTPLLTGLLLLYFAAYVLRAGMGLVAGPVAGAGLLRAAHPLISPGLPQAPAGAGRVLLRHAPEVAAACRVSMALGMFAMLLAL